MSCSKYLLCALALICLLPQAASAALFRWDGGSGIGPFGGDNNWSTNTNWRPNPGGTAPPDDGTADIELTGGMRTTPNVDMTWSIKSRRINLTSINGNFILGGSTLTIGSGGLESVVTLGSGLVTGGPNTVNTDIVLGAAQTWTGHNLVVEGDIDNDGHKLRIDLSSAPFTINGAISGTGGLEKAGFSAFDDRVVTLGGSGANTHTGTTTVKGTLVLNKSAFDGAIFTDLVIGDGVRESVCNCADDRVRLDASDQIRATVGTLVTNTVTINRYGTLDLNGNSDAIGHMIIDGGRSPVGEC